MNRTCLQTHFLILVFSFTTLCATGGFGQSIQDRVPILIDTDTANEVDDLYALVRALVEPKFDLLGITSAQFHTSPLASDTTVLESQKINEDILDLMKRQDIKRPLGSNKPILDSNAPMESEAMHHIIRMAHQMPVGKQLHVVVLGPCTNVASAVLKDPSIVPKIKVHYIGFWHDVKTNSYNKKEFNTGNDPLAVEILLNTKGLDLNIMSATTSQHLVFEKTDVDAQLKGKGGVADYLVERWENYERWWTQKDSEKKRWIMWDLAIIEALAHPELAKKEAFTTPAENTNRSIHIYTSIEVEEMVADFWESLKHYGLLEK
ncbi:nucleoside hydrolase [Spongiimicrobium sp. 2-473A-2-J]|uniref:nucleoside hydrolase n=1 Tax=Eudoraea algarum TaxID=3417568 RepID=UPI003D36876E